MQHFSSTFIEETLEGVEYKPKHLEVVTAIGGGIPKVYDFPSFESMLTQQLLREFSKNREGVLGRIWNIPITGKACLPLYARKLMSWFIYQLASLLKRRHLWVC